MPLLVGRKRQRNPGATDQRTVHGCSRHGAEAHVRPAVESSLALTVWCPAAVESFIALPQRGNVGCDARSGRAELKIEIDGADHVVPPRRFPPGTVVKLCVGAALVAAMFPALFA